MPYRARRGAEWIVGHPEEALVGRFGSKSYSCENQPSSNGQGISILSAGDRRSRNRGGLRRRHEGNTADDDLGKLIAGAGNQGGFRAVGSWDAPRLLILYSSMDDPDWPDFIDVYTGVFTYFGDNRKPGP